MFLHFHRKYNMILFILQILNHIQIKTLNSLFLFYNSITYVKKKYKHTHISILIPLFTFLASGDLQQNKTQAVVFIYFFLLRSVESFSLFVVLSFFRWWTALRSGRPWLVVGDSVYFVVLWAAGSRAKLCCTRHRQTTRGDG